MLYTSYIANLINLPKDLIKIIIPRFPPRNLYYSNYSNLFVTQDLAPSERLLYLYKHKNKSWGWYVYNFNNEMKNNSYLINGINTLERLLLKGKDIVLLCYEKDYKHCHRYLIAQYFINKGFKWREL